MDTVSLYRCCEQQGIAVMEFPLSYTGSMSVDMGERCYIGIDPAIVSTETLERVHLAHEIGHCVTGSFYNRYAAADIRQRHENRADKWAVKKLISAAALDRAVANGYTELWELAEHFGVTEDFMKKAVCWYTHRNLAAELYF